MKTITVRQCLVLVLILGLVLFAWKKRNECEGKLPAENSRKQMECNEYFFLRATALV